MLNAETQRTRGERREVEDSSNLDFFLRVLCAFSSPLRFAFACTTPTERVQESLLLFWHLPFFGIFYPTLRRGCVEQEALGRTLHRR